MGGSRRGRSPYRRLLATGYKQCVWHVERHSVEVPKEYSSYRVGVVQHGARCKRLVSPKDQETHGVCVCDSHWPFYQKAQLAASILKTHLRAKYDSGPLPLEEDK